MSSPSKYPPRFYEIVQEALKDSAVGIPHDVLYKFARLIAQECSDIAMELGRTDTNDEYNELSDYGKGCADTTMILASNIKYMFR
jgi:hypothetical protein